MQYLLMIHSDEAAMQQARKEDMQGMMAAYGAYTQAMKEAGVYLGGERLHPSSTATVVRAQNGKTSVLNGPYAEVRSNSAAITSSRRPTSTRAIGWAARCPGAQFGAIEVRPIWAM